MVDYYDIEMHYELRNPRWGWPLRIWKQTGERTSERKGGQWKVVRQTIFHDDVQVDPEWAKQQSQAIRDLMNTVTGPNK